MPPVRDLVLAAALVFVALFLLFGPVETPRDPWPGLPYATNLSAADPQCELTGYVVDPRGRPIPGALIRSDYRVWGRAETATPDWQRVEVDGPETNSARDGTFALPIGPGEIVDLCVRADGHGEAMIAWRRPGDHVRIVLTEGADLTVNVGDENGNPLPDVRVFVLRVLPFLKPIHWHSGVTNAEGRYFHPRLSEAIAEIQVVADGRVMEEPRRILIPPSGTVVADVRLVPGAPKTSSRPTAPPISGLVVDDAGVPVDGARVVYGDIGFRTDPSGELALPRLPRSPAALTIWTPGRGRIVVGPGGAPRRDTWRLRAGRTVSGRAAPALAGAVVELDRGPLTREIAVLDDRGTFRFADVAPGWWRLTLLHPSVDSESREVVVEEGKDPEVVVFRAGQ